jgi:chorismate mutase|tara:strand:+ start:139 stop:396 length:258 start_codon:yes stop_codon:yes gene_type:complete
MSLENYRKELDIIDNQIIELLVKRFKVIDKVSEHKKKNNIEIIQKERMKEIYRKVEALAIESNLDPKFTHELFELIMNEAIRREK